MPKYYGKGIYQVVSQSGLPIAGALVYIYNDGTSVLATLKDDDENDIANPVRTNFGGNYEFSAEIGFYDHRIVAGGATVNKYRVPVGLGAGGDPYFNPSLSLCSLVSSDLPDSPSTWRGLGFGDGKLVAVDDQNGRSATSEDGINWSVHSSTVYCNTKNLIYDGSGWKCWGFKSNASGRIEGPYSSPNGETWTDVSADVGVLGRLYYGLQHSGSTYAIAAQPTANSLTSIRYSSDFLSWSSNSILGMNLSPLCGLFASGKFIFGGTWQNTSDATKDGRAALIIGTDPSDDNTWSSVFLTDTGADGDVDDIAFDGESTLMAVGNEEDDPVSWVSEDGGATWSKRETSITSFNSFQSLAYGQGRWFAIGSDGTPAWSRDNGQSWTLCSLVTVGENATAFNENAGTFCTVGETAHSHADPR